MRNYIIVGVISGILLGVMDGLIYANPLAQRLYAVYKPIVKTSVNIPIGIMIDFVYGFVMAGIFMLLYQSLPGELSIVKGISFAILVWFFRVVMTSASQSMMFNVSRHALLYSLATGLIEILILGLLYGLTLHAVTS